jgi:hypothetical protein
MVQIGLQTGPKNLLNTPTQTDDTYAKLACAVPSSSIVSVSWFFCVNDLEHEAIVTLAREMGSVL